MVSTLSPGTKANLELWRKGKTKNISLSVGEMKVAGGQSKANRDDSDELGLSVRPLTPEERKQADVSSGLLVENVEDGPAARAGIQRGDVILSVNGERTGSIEKLRAQVSKHGKRLALLILRGEQQMFVPLSLG